MANFLFGACLLLAVGDWVSVWRCSRLGEMIFKPATLVALIAGFVAACGSFAPAGWFTAGLVLSLAGDVFLMLSPRFFMGGLAAFLAAHLAYIAGFNQSLPPVTIPGMLIAAAFVFAAVLLYRRIARALTRRGSGPVLRYGVLVYSLALTGMALSAALNLTRPGWTLVPALLTAAGGLLFFASDSLLAIRRFDTPIRNGRLFEHITYHLGQLGLMLGIVFYLTNKI